MLRYILCFCLLLSVGFHGFAQNNNADKRFNDVMLDLVASNSVEAFRVADSLMQNAKTDLDKIKANLVISFVHQSVGTYSLAVNYAQRADKISNLLGLLDYETSSAILLASIYREIGVFEESSNYIKRAKSNIKGINDSSAYYLLEIQIIQEEAKLLISSKRYSDAIDLINAAIMKKGYIDVNHKASILLRSKNHLILADCYNQLGNPSESIPYLKRVLDDVAGMETLLRPYAYQMLTEAYFNLGQLDSAKVFFDLELPYIESSNNMELKSRFYFQSAKYYGKIGDHKLSLTYFDQYSKLIEQNHNTAQIIGNGLLKSNIEEIVLLRRNNLILIWTLIIGLSLFILYYFIKIHPKNEISESQTQYIQNNDHESLNPNHKSLEKENTIVNLDSQISLETETRLVKKLNDLEDEKFFLDKSITLGTLTNKINSNQKYVSYIIRKYKNQHFNDYILNLRIQYIVQQLESNKIMLDYKLSYLADMSGFTSHSKFTIAFKNVMNITPSQFIEQLKANKE